MSKLPLKRKVEKAFQSDYLPAVMSIAGLHIYAGHEANDEKEFPHLVVYAEDLQDYSGMPTCAGVRTVRLRCQFVADCAGGRGTVDDWEEQLEAAMGDLAGIQSALNAPASGIDRRMITGIHIHDVIPSGEPSDRNELDWVEQRLYDVTVERVG